MQQIEKTAGLNEDIIIIVQLIEKTLFSCQHYWKTLCNAIRGSWCWIGCSCEKCQSACGWGWWHWMWIAQELGVDWIRRYRNCNEDQEKITNKCFKILLFFNWISSDLLTFYFKNRKIDLDTIDLSNLNRQFLFQRKHIGLSKAQVAKESVQRMNPRAKIVAHHANIKNAEFGIEFFQKFTIILNALDNLGRKTKV